MYIILKKLEKLESSRDLQCLIVYLMNFLVQGFILNDVNNGLNLLVSAES